MKASAVLAAVAALFMLVSATLAPTVARAAKDPLDVCMAEGARALEARSARPAVPVRRLFLTEGEARVVPLRLRRAGCFGVLAVGRAGIEDLDAVLYTAGGIRLDADVTPEPHAYVRYCGAAGLELAMVLRAVRGRGEIAWRAFVDAPSRLPDLNAQVGGCFARSGGVSAGAANVGPEPSGGDVDRVLSAASGPLEAAGYRRVGPVLRGRLSARQTDSRKVPLSTGHCYRFVAVGDAGVLDLDLRVHDPAGKVIAQDGRRLRSAQTRACVSTAGTYGLEVRMYGGQGAWALAVLDLVRIPSPLSPGVHGDAVAGYAEMVAHLSERGLALRSGTWGYVRGGEEDGLGVPVQLAAGQCYGFGVVGADALGPGTLQIALVDPEGRLRARDADAATDPIVFDCPERSGVFHVHARTGGRGGPFLVVEGATAAGGTAP